MQSCYRVWCHRQQERRRRKFRHSGPSSVGIKLVPLILLLISHLTRLTIPMQYPSCSSKVGITLPWEWQVRPAVLLLGFLLELIRSASFRNGNAHAIPVEMGRQKCCKQPPVKMPFVNTDRIAKTLQVYLTAME